MNRKKARNSGVPESGPTLQRTDLLDHLWRVQDEHGYIRSEDIAACGESLGISTIEVEGVISFYHFFDPSAPRTVHDLSEQQSRWLRARDSSGSERPSRWPPARRFNGVDPSGQCGLFETACIGLSDMEPAALIDFYPFTNLNSLKVRDIVARLKQGAIASRNL